MFICGNLSIILFDHCSSYPTTARIRDGVVEIFSLAGLVVHGRLLFFYRNVRSDIIRESRANAHVYIDSLLRTECKVLYKLRAQ